MANQDHLDILKQGTETWNQWRKEHPGVQPDLNRANLRGVEFISIDLSGANLFRANLSNSNLGKANLNGANLNEADLNRANLAMADLRNATLRGANLWGAILKIAHLWDADLEGANLRDAELEGAALMRANLRGAILECANLLRVNLEGAILIDCHVHGISAWNVELEGAKQDNLVITSGFEPTITVDNLEVAQFIYLLLNNTKIRDVINTITTKAVLILGRFTPPRKVILDALREALRTYGYVPILFDFDKPASRDLTETVSTLAHLARFIIVDLTDPSSAPHEVATVIPYTVVPVQPLILDGEREYSMFRDLRRRYDWVLPTHTYTDQAHLLATLKEHVIAPAEQKAQELEKR